VKAQDKYTDLQPN